jgi:hypothetical protein
VAGTYATGKRICFIAQLFQQSLLTSNPVGHCCRSARTIDAQIWLLRPMGDHTVLASHACLYIRNRQDHIVVSTSYKHVRCENFQVNSSKMWRYAASKRIQAKAISSVRQSNRTYRPRCATRVTIAHNG